MKLKSVTLLQGTHHTPVLTAGTDYESLELLTSGVVAARSGDRVELFWQINKAVADTAAPAESTKKR